MKRKDAAVDAQSVALEENSAKPHLESALASSDDEPNALAPAAPANEHDLPESSVKLSVSTDPTILYALIDRTASQKRIIQDLNAALPKLSVPYREIDPLILKAIEITLSENVTFEEASIVVFGNTSFARKIRYWRNRWELQ